ncbi:NAD(P)/FAD-dependent oxidoreductase [Yinghuangia seranimata]|uniref:NAD(P)/FAD-dependent oxidoreductase n=1 Tax=Yinghuangia seranimata TaxID=408067 RepID=UPI00248C0E11|nr:FAD-dependent oxidoreductase [Yinghuangia seranimata]MDI2130439.1 FAD-dependent oxidoreductase [Yinghuangia seranimata]
MSSPKVAVVGGGYAGAAVAKALDAETDVVLVEPKDGFVQAAASLRALVRPDWAHNAFFPYDRLLRRGTVVHERAVSVDPDGVTLASGTRIDADYVVLATGSAYPYPAKPATGSTADALAQLHRTHKELANAERVLLLGAGPVGLELAGEIKAVWPDKHVTVVDRRGELLPGFLPAVREELHRQLDDLGVELRLNTTLSAPPATEPGRAGAFTVDTDGGPLTADIWFRCHGVQVTSDYLAGGLEAARTASGQVRVTEHLAVEGHSHIYAIGDLTDLAEAKMAGYAMQHADVVARNILAHAAGSAPEATYRPADAPMIMLPLGTTGGVGQIPGEDGPMPLTAQQVAEWKGADLFTGRFAEQFGTA